MRYESKTDGDSVPGYFAGDLEGGGTRLECGNCSHQQDDNVKFGEITICEKCNKELHYCSYWEW